MLWSSRRTLRPPPDDEPSMFAPGELVIFVVGMALLVAMLGYMILK